MYKHVRRCVWSIKYLVQTERVKCLKECLLQRKSILNCEYNECSYNFPLPVRVSNSHDVTTSRSDTHHHHLKEQSYSVVFFVTLRSNAGYGLIQNVSKSHTTHQSAGLLWTIYQLVAETSTWQHTTITSEGHPCPGGIWTHLSRRSGSDLRLRPHGNGTGILPI